MKILVTGGSGYIGSVTLRRLMAAGHKVAIFDNLERGHRETVPAGVPLHVGDLRNAAEIEAAMEAERPDAVMHCAAWTNVDGAESNEEACRRINVTGTENIARVCGPLRFPYG